MRDPKQLFFVHDAGSATASAATGGHGRPREATGGNGRPREATGGNGRQREATPVPHFLVRLPEPTPLTHTARTPKAHAVWGITRQQIVEQKEKQQRSNKTITICKYNYRNTSNSSR